MILFEHSSVRIHNTNDDIAQKIGGLWDKYMVNQKATEVYGVYHSYEGNYKNAYTLSICLPTNEASTNIRFDTNNFQYKTYPVALNNPHEILSTWQRIWADEEEDHLKRAYGVDYEHYREDGVTIYISVV